MSFSWANLNLAKQALKNAQKKIDAVLDIHDEEDEEGGEDATPVLDIDQPFITGMESTSVVCEQPSGTPTLDVVSEAATSECDQWSHEWRTDKKHDDVIVDAEPNPIHDVVPHSSSALLNHSPNSNSPDEADTEEDGRGGGSQQEESADDHTETVEGGDIFSNIPLNSPPSETKHSLSRRSSRHEDQLTVASSDIEVIRNVDTWSLASSAMKGGPLAIEHAEGMPAPKLGDTLETMKGQLRHHEQRIDELTTANSKLQQTNGQLQQRIIALNQQEKSLRKELSQKEQERIDILEEGKKMSDYSGKQSREIRRMKAQVADFEKVQAERKKYKDEKADAENVIQGLREEISELNAKVQELDKCLQSERNEKNVNERASEHHKNQHEESARIIAELEEENRKAKETITSLTQTEEALRERLRFVSDNEMASRLSCERANEAAIIAHEESADLRRQNELLKQKLSEAQRKLESSMQSRDSMVEATAKATAPLMAEIDELKATLAHERSAIDDYDNEIRRLEKKIEDMQRESERLNQSLSSSNDRSSSELAHLLHKIAKLENQLTSSELTHKAQLETVVEEKKELLRRLEVEKKNVEDLKEECNAIRSVAATLEKTQSTLREQLAVERERSLERSESDFGEPTEIPCTAPSPSPQGRDELTAMGTTTPAGNSQSFAATLTQGGSAVESELSSLLRNHEMSIRRVGELEAKMRRNEETIEAKEKALKEMRAKYKELDYQYNRLLEVDGERLEKIDELQHDVLDLRQLLKEQLLAFAAVNESREEVPPNGDTTSD